jgi:ectoine hydroxylase-related dioxygenase (phytanoyl-CoA dioxygenase family)
MTPETTVEHFRVHGWMRVPAAFTADHAAAMRAATWRAFATVGIMQSDPSTWTDERPVHLKELKADPAFRAVGSARVIDAIDAVLEGQEYDRPKNWGAVFVALPSTQAWTVPSRGWHADANYMSAVSPPAGVRTHALFGDVAPRAGGTLIVAGSHRLVHQYFANNPPPAGTRGAEFRTLLQGHPYIRDLHTEGDAADRAARFMGRAEEHDGVLLQVVENTGDAGDVILLHPLVLHVATPNSGTAPRFLLSGAVDLPAMWPAFRSPAAGRDDGRSG